MMNNNNSSSSPYGGSGGPSNYGAPSSYHQADSEPQNLNQHQRFLGPGGFRPPSNSYGRPVQPTYQQVLQPALYSNRGPIAKNEAPPRIVPISSLNPYQGRWTIRARVTSKGDLRRYSNPRGEGKVFSFDLLDSEGGEIRVTCFNAVADQFFDQVEAGKVYLISRGSLKPVVQRNFNHLNSEYEIFLESTSTVQPCGEEDDGSIPRVQFNLRSIAEIEAAEANSIVDLAGVVSAVNPASSVMRKNGTETLKRTLQLRDMSGRSVELTLWGSFCNAEGQRLQQMCDAGLFPVLVVKAARVNDFSGRSVGTISSSQLFVDPDFPAARRLREWHDGEGRHSAAVSISRDSGAAAGGRADDRKTVSQIKDEGLGRSEKPDWITVKATVTFLKVDNFCYTACPLLVGDRPCNKKVNNNGDGTWRCDRCDRSFPECDYRYLLQLQVQDHTGLTWVTAFQEAGEEIVGAAAKELYALKYEEQDDARFAEIVRGVLFREYLLKLKVKEETFSDEQRVKSTVVRAERVNPSSESRHLLALIDKVSSAPPPEPAIAGMSGGYSYSSSARSAAAPRIYPPAEPPRPHMTGRQQVNPYDGGGGGAYGPAPRVAVAAAERAMGAGAYVNRAPTVGLGDGGGGGGAASGNCFKCQQPGHWARDCPGGAGATAQGYGGGGVPGRYGFPKPPQQQQLGGY